MNEAAKCAKLLKDTKFDYQTEKLDRAFRMWARHNHPDKFSGAIKLNATAIFANVKNCLEDMKRNPAFLDAVRKYSFPSSGPTDKQPKTVKTVIDVMYMIFEGVFASKLGKIFLAMFGSYLTGLLLQAIFHRLLSCLFYLAMRYTNNESLPAWIRQKISATESKRRKRSKQPKRSKRRSVVKKSTRAMSPSQNREIQQLSQILVADYQSPHSTHSRSQSRPRPRSRSRLRAGSKQRTRSRIHTSLRQ